MNVARLACNIKCDFFVIESHTWSRIAVHTEFRTWFHIESHTRSRTWFHIESHTRSHILLHEIVKVIIVTSVVL